MLKDRGNIKWTAMMLPEHVKMLRNWGKEEDYSIPTEKTEWELEELQRIIQKAARTNKELHLTLWINQAWHYETGIITATDMAKRELLLETASTVKRILLSTIHSAKLMDEYDD